MTKEEQLDKLVEELRSELDTCYTPLYPWVLVRKLSKEQTRNGIILPATEQNKTVHEGIVMAVWRPVKRWVRSRSSDNKNTHDLIDRESVFKRGDHVLFPHWAGLPMTGLSDERYRLVREEDWAENTNGGIIAVVEYEQKLREKLVATVGEVTAGFDASMDVLLDNFIVLDKKQQSVTLSGR